MSTTEPATLAPATHVTLHAMAVWLLMTGTCNAGEVPQAIRDALHLERTEVIPNSDAAVLVSNAAISSRNNLQTIKTWTGQCRISDSMLMSSGPSPDEGSPRVNGRFMRHIDASIEFKCDTTVDSVNSHFIPIGPFRYTDLVSGQQSEVDAPTGDHWSILTPSRFLSFRANEAAASLPGDPVVQGWSPQSSQVLRRKKVEAGDRLLQFGDVFDPRLLFSDPSGNLPYADFKYIADGLTEKGPAEASFSTHMVDSNPELILALVEFGSPGESGSIYYGTLIDLGPPASTEAVAIATNNKLYSLCRIEYAGVDGLSLPKRYEYAQYDQNGGNISIRRSVHIQEQAVNVDLASDTFEVDAFGLAAGDRVFDEATRQVELINSMGKIVSAEEFERTYAAGFDLHGIPRNSSMPRVRQRVSVAFIANLCIIAVLVVWIAVSRLSRAR